MFSKAPVRLLSAVDQKLTLAPVRLVDLASVSPWRHAYSELLMMWIPLRLRGFLVIFELIQLLKLAMVSFRRFIFSHSPRDIWEMTKPGYFEYAIGACSS